MSVKILHCTEATATSGRVGQSVTTDGKIDVTLATQKEPGRASVTAERPFAVGHATWFPSATKSASAKGKVTRPADPKATARRGIGPRKDGQGFGLDVDLKNSLPGPVAETAEKMIHGDDLV